MSTPSTPRTGPSRTNLPVQILLDTNNPKATRPLKSQQLTICWQVSRRALGKQAPPGTSQAVHLEAKVANNAIHWSLIDPQRTSLEKTGSKNTDRLCVSADQQSRPINITQTNALLCIESTTLSCIIATPSGKPAQLLYVRTTLFNRLRLPGGRYTPPTCTLIEA